MLGAQLTILMTVLTREDGEGRRDGDSDGELLGPHWARELRVGYSQRPAAATWPKISNLRLELLLPLPSQADRGGSSL